MSQDHPSFAQARGDGFLRVSRWNATSRARPLWWRECRAADRPWIVVCERPRRALVVADLAAKREIACLTEPAMRRLEAIVRQICGGTLPPRAEFGPEIIHIEGITSDTAVQVAAELVAYLADPTVYASWPATRHIRQST